MHRRLCHRYPSQDGFTLLEMLVVLVITAMVLSVALLSGRSKAPNLQILSTDLASQLNLARVTAITRARPVTVVIDRNGKTLRSPASRASFSLPESARLAFSPVEGIGRPDRQSHLTFFADGSSTGGVFKLFDRTRSTIIRVDWLSGSVTRETGR